MQAKNGSRSLVVAAIKEAETLSFAEFIEKYEDIVVRARKGKLTMDDFSGVTISLTNPGGIGTRHSVPRLTRGKAPSSAWDPWTTLLSSRAHRRIA